MLGQGAFGTVWLMKDLQQNGTLVAIKCMNRLSVTFAFFLLSSLPVIGPVDNYNDNRSKMRTWPFKKP